MKVVRICFSYVIFLALTSCLDRIDIGTPDSKFSQIVVDGFISDERGPYTVKLTRTLGIEDDLRLARPFSAQRVTISDNTGNSQDLDEVELGVYQTKPFGTFRGVVGREYTLRIEARDGNVYQSMPEKIEPAGKIDTVYYELISFKPADGPTEYGFNIYLDSHTANNSDNYLRWKFTGTYKIKTNPELHTRRVGEATVPDPLACCEICWLTQFEDKPKVSDNQVISEGQFKKVFVGYVPINGRTFYEKYKVEVKQMSLTRNSFEYWKTVQAQLEGSGSLFQPPLGKPKTNIFNLNGTSEVQGLFYASSVVSKVIYIEASDVPFSVTPALTFPDTCTAFEYSTEQQPLDWN